MKVYADEAYYEIRYLGGRKPVIRAGFVYYARQSSRTIDQYTSGRLKNKAEDEIPDEVRMCCCELAEAEYRRIRQQNDSGGKSSEKIGTYSVSYGTAQEMASAASMERKNIVYKWLEDTGLCYRGVE